MPILHKYRDKRGWFIRTVIHGSIITFQLTPAGARQLLEAGIKDGKRFRRAILFNLWSIGDAYTHGTGVGIIRPYVKGQLEIDFSNDPEPDTIFPGCSICGSLDGLNLVEVLRKDKHYAGLYCPVCRKKSSAAIDTSIPLPLVTRGVFSGVLDLKGISVLNKSASAYKDSLERAFNEKWDKIIEQKIQISRGIQETLFDEKGGQKKLI